MLIIISLHCAKHFCLCCEHTGLWNSIFLWSNVSLILLMPFAYFFIESQGLPGARKVTSHSELFLSSFAQQVYNNSNNNNNNMIIPFII